MQCINSQNVRVFLALLKRTSFVIIPHLKKGLIDGLFLTSIYVLLFGYLYPQMGMSKSLIGPVFIGSILTLLCSLSYSLAVRMVLDLKYGRFIDYLFTIPTTPFWIFLWYICSFFIELVLATAPLLTFGLFLLSTKIDLSMAHIPWFIAMYCASLLFCSIIFLGFGIRYDYDWFFDNIWARRLTPCLIASCSMFPWYRVNNFSTGIAKLFLLNPVTYIAEGLRGSLFDPTLSLSMPICLIMLFVFNGLAVLFLINSIKKTFNTV